jgi:hypothetical protein
MSIFPIDVRTLADGGLPPERLRALAEAEGVRISVLDPGRGVGARAPRRPADGRAHVRQLALLPRYARGRAAAHHPRRPDLFSDAMDALPAAEVGRRVADALAGALTAAPHAGATATLF